MRKNFLVVSSGYISGPDDVWILDGADAHATKWLLDAGVPQRFFDEAELGDIMNFDRDRYVQRVGRVWSKYDDCWLE